MMNRWSEFLAWENYIEEDLVRAEIEEIRAEASLKIVEAQAMAAAAREGTVTVQKAVARASQPYERAHDRYILARELRKVLAVQQASLARVSSFISRELSRRTASDPATRRAGRHSP